MQYIISAKQKGEEKGEEKEESRSLMGEIHLAGLLVLSTIVACGFAYSFALVSRIKLIIAKVWQEERFEGIGPKSDRSMINARRIALTLSINGEEDEVIFAQSNKDFVEVLFSFLTLPLGEITRLCRQKTGIPPLDNLYGSVQALDEQSFQTAESKKKLLHPRSAHRHSRGLATELDRIEPLFNYICSRRDCGDCVNAMSADKTGGFLQDRGKFIISDDLVVLPATTTNMKVLIERKKKSSSGTKVRDVTIGTKEVLQILKFSMMSTRPLTNVLLRDNLNKGSEGRCNTFSRRQLYVPKKTIKANLLVKRSTGNIIGLEAREDLVDILFSFLTVPLGSVGKLCSEEGSFLGCISTLRWSIEQLHFDYFKSITSKNLLLSPKIAPKYGRQSWLQKIEEETEQRFDRKLDIIRNSYLENRRLGSSKRVDIINPKIPGQITRGGGLLKKKETLIITNDLRIEFLDPALHVSRVNSHDVRIIGIDLDEEKVLEILLSMMTSTNVLDDVFYNVALFSYDGMPAYTLNN